MTYGSYYGYPDNDEGYDEYELAQRFANPGGRSALHPESSNNPRNLPCPTCGEPNRLTQRDKNKGYQCNSCADAAEGFGP